MNREEYEKARLAVLAAQEKRIASEIEHVSPCDCPICQEEIAARQVMEEMSEHILEQKNWVVLMLERLGRI